MSESTLVAEGTLLWEPSEAQRSRCRLASYMQWLATERGEHFTDYPSLWQWSVDHPGAFWASVWDYFSVIAHAPYSEALIQRTMPDAQWFLGATLNHAEHLLRRRDDHLAVIARSEDGTERRLTYRQLAALAARCAAGLAALGVGKGDRVAAFLPNTETTLAVFLGVASLGAVWSSCSPDFGVPSVLDRFRQIEPKVLLTVDGYRYGGRFFDRREAVTAIQAGLSSLQATVCLPGPVEGRGIDGALGWDEFLGDVGGDELTFEPVDFDHPLWVVYSSGTTGLPKAIVHGHGGILLEHYKALALHGDLGPDDRFFWFSTTGWMMWNYLIGGLLTGSTVVLYDGHPMHPDPLALWRMAEETEVTWFGASAPYFMSCRKAGLVPKHEFDLSRIRGVGSTGAPLPAEGFVWVYEAVGDDLNLASVSGGTDVCTAFVLGCPLLPVHAGEIQCRGLGCAVESWDPEGRPILGEVGELVLTEPLPSMPVFFWNDPDGERMRDSYFSTYEGVWRHGDWVKVTERGSCVVYGRSDSTLNRGGVRMGTSEFYRVVEAMPEVADSLVVDTSAPGESGRLWLFVVPADDVSWGDALADRIRRTLRETISPRHVPDELIPVEAVPYTLSGKKIEIPVKRILTGTPPELAVSQDTLRNPEALAPFLALASPGDSG